jgi:hypothetical protein
MMLLAPKKERQGFRDKKALRTKHPMYYPNQRTTEKIEEPNRHMDSTNGTEQYSSATQELLIPQQEPDLVEITAPIADKRRGFIIQMLFP